MSRTAKHNLPSKIYLTPDNLDGEDIWVWTDGPVTKHDHEKDAQLYIKAIKDYSTGKMINPIDECIRLSYEITVLKAERDELVALVTSALNGDVTNLRDYIAWRIKAQAALDKVKEQEG